MTETSDSIELASRFTPGEYQELLESCRRARYTFVLSGALSGRSTPPDRRRLVWLRHDVELSADAAVEMARVEHSLGIAATYLLCPQSPFVPPPALRGLTARLAGLGHEVGLHLVHDAEDGREGLRDLADHWAEKLGLAPGGPVSLHAPRMRNAAEVARRCPTPHLYTCYVSGGWRYLSDSTGNWRWGHPLEHLVPGGSPLYVLTHPFWWFGRPIRHPRPVALDFLPQYNEEP
ncbi:hypothetical protein D0T12_19005 [Actinomadura spongiicola]|uniref:Uncharacterized protein n=1 Tax=Actinomadura spongiicola TaxID=2303421 RepID=A0A372GFR4_9ACTN|nr:hypothetical protein [Actinomadura spongiicola]RFS84226.1 hypothetical protein D0T12_19005 [Actinomadura spongiicola]